MFRPVAYALEESKEFFVPMHTKEHVKQIGLYGSFNTICSLTDYYCASTAVLGIEKFAHIYEGLSCMTI